MERYKAERLAHPPKSSEVTPVDRPVEADEKLTRNTQTPNKAEHQSDTLYIELQHIFRMKGLYKDPALRIEDVAQLLNVSPRQISNVLKEREDLNFRQYVNRYRILEARHIMEDPANDILKLEAIGEMSGFTSRSHFQKVFESVAGVTPGFYRRNILVRSDAAMPEEPSDLS
jgi:AraC-like DNA-binding protein